MYLKHTLNIFINNILNLFTKNSYKSEIIGSRNIIINVIKDLQDFGQKYATIFYINSMQNFYEISKI